MTGISQILVYLLAARLSQVTQVHSAEPIRVWERPGGQRQGGRPEQGICLRARPWASSALHIASRPSRDTLVRLSGGERVWASGKVLKGPQGCTLPGSTQATKESTETGALPHSAGEGNEVQGVRVHSLQASHLVRSSWSEILSQDPGLHGPGSTHSKSLTCP